MTGTRNRIVLALVAALGAALVTALPAAAQSAEDEIAFYPATHSHNDYLQPRPLLDALDSGMGSIEADVFYAETSFQDAEGQERAMRELLVAHDWEDIEGNVMGFPRSKGTLTDVYLEPLWEVYHERGGTIYPQGTLLLHVDFKTETEATWRVVENTLRNYPGLFTRFDVEEQRVIPGPVTVYTNDEPDDDVLAEYGVIHSTADGRFGDIYDPSVWESDDYQDRAWRMPIISSNLLAYNDIEQMFEFLDDEEEIVADYQDDYPDLTTDNLVEELDSDGWALANDLIQDRRMRVTDYLIEQMVEADRLGRTHGHLMRFWASPDAKWFWDIVAPLEQVMLLTDHPRDVRTYLESREMLDRISAP